MENRMKNHIFVLLVLVECSPFLAGTVGFDGDTEGASSKGFTTALTGRGSQGNWVVRSRAGQRLGRQCGALQGREWKA
jgi:hypothetical protein